MHVNTRHIVTADGWRLCLRKAVVPDRLVRDHRPILIVPGYGMNSFIFRYHPRGTSMERTLAEAGYEVWSMDLRGQGDSQPTHRRAGGVSLWHYAMFDLPAAVAGVMAGTASTARDLTLLGGSLGGTISYSYLALRARAHPVGQLVTVAAPLRWNAVHPVVRTLFASRFLAGSVRLSRTRDMVRGAMPLLLRTPQLLGMYINTATVDTGQMHELTRTVEDPPRKLNLDIARWLRSRDLELGGVNVTRALGAQNMPLLVMYGNRDGVVPEPTVLSVVDAWGGTDIRVVRVGDDENWYAHANLFVADDAPERVFQPMIRWLQRDA